MRFFLENLLDILFYFLYIHYHIVNAMTIPRLCNGSTSDSGSDCGGSNPPWGTKAEPTGSAFFICYGPFVYRLGRDPLKVERRVRFP